MFTEKMPITGPFGLEYISNDKDSLCNVFNHTFIDSQSQQQGKSMMFFHLDYVAPDKLLLFAFKLAENMPFVEKWQLKAEISQPGLCVKPL